MPRLSAFRGLRFDVGQVGSLANVICPPRHLIDAQLLKQLYERHPANAVRLVANREEPGDSQEDRFARAARFLRQWQRKGLLQREPDPAVYAYHAQFEDQGETKTFRGLICRVEIESLGQIASEADQPEFQDDLKLIELSQANLRPVLGMYDDFGVQSLVDDAMVNVAPIEAREPAAARSYRVWPVHDIYLINEVTSVMEDVDLSIAGGHEVLSAAKHYREQLGGSELSPLHGANHLMICIAARDQVDDPVAASLLVNGLIFSPHEA